MIPSRYIGISGDIAREFKFQKIDLIESSYILALAREDELNDIIKPYTKKKDVCIYRLKPARGVRIKTHGEREKNRERKLYYYFNRVPE